MSAFFIIYLLEHGIEMALGWPDATLQETDDLIAGLRDLSPPMTESSIEEAALYAWGAFALNELDSDPFPPEVIERYLALMPRPAGSMRELRDALVGPGSPTPSGLIEVIARNPVPDDLPEEQEIVIFTEMTFELADARSVTARLRRAKPEFMQEDDHTFAWTRDYPKGHWSPLKAVGGRQILGSVRVTGDELVAATKTLSMAARLVAILKEMFGDAIRLRDTRWRGARDLLRDMKP